MTKNYGIKVSRPGYDAKNAQPNQLAFSSAYKTLKVHTSGSGTLTDGSRTATIAHNLGYVPFFMVHAEGNAGFGSGLFSSGDYALSPLGLGGVLADPSMGFNDDLIAYADATNLYIKAQENFGKIIGLAKDTNDYYNTFFGGTGGIIVGDSGGSADDGAIRFHNVYVPQGSTIYSARIRFWVWEKGAGSGNLFFKCFGMDEDNTADFSSYPLGRPDTTAHIDPGQITIPSANSYLNINVPDIVEEIVGRGGWSSGNAMGLKFYEEGSSNNDVWFHTSDGIGTTYIEILLSDTIANYKYTIFKNQLE